MFFTLLLFYSSIFSPTRWLFTLLLFYSSIFSPTKCWRVDGTPTRTQITRRRPIAGSLTFICLSSLLIFVFFAVFPTRKAIKISLLGFFAYSFSCPYLSFLFFLTTFRTKSSSVFQLVKGSFRCFNLPLPPLSYTLHRAYILVWNDCVN